MSSIQAQEKFERPRSLSMRRERRRRSRTSCQVREEHLSRQYFRSHTPLSRVTPGPANTTEPTIRSRSRGKRGRRSASTRIASSCPFQGVICPIVPIVNGSQRRFTADGVRREAGHVYRGIGDHGFSGPSGAEAPKREVRVEHECARQDAERPADETGPNAGGKRVPHVDDRSPPADQRRDTGNDAGARRHRMNDIDVELARKRARPLRQCGRGFLLPAATDAVPTSSRRRAN